MIELLGQLMPDLAMAAAFVSAGLIGMIYKNRTRTAKIFCEECGASVELKRNANGKNSAMIDALNGWHFDAKGGWRCPKHIDIQELDRGEA